MNVSSVPSPPAIGEILAAVTTGFIAQVSETGFASANEAIPPAFGSFVRVGSAAAEALSADFDPFETAPQPPPADDSPLTLYGVVYLVEAGAVEGGRSPFGGGFGGDPARSATTEVPTTRFSVALVAYAGADGVIRPYLPPRPPRPHDAVYAADDSETRRLTERLDYLRSLLGGGSGLIYPADELVAALLRRAWRARGGDEQFLLRAGRELATLLPQDYDRLRALLASIVG